MIGVARLGKDWWGGSWAWIWDGWK